MNGSKKSARKNEEHDAETKAKTNPNLLTFWMDFGLLLGPFLAPKTGQNSMLFLGWFFRV